jgi:aminoglycoside phosphotransferase (APT) family kinase protein
MVEDCREMTSDLTNTVLAVAARELHAYARRVGDAGFGSVPEMAAALLDDLVANMTVPAAPERSLSAEQIAPVLVAAGIAQAGARVEIGRSAVGFAKDTFMVQLFESADSARTLVVRRDLPAGPTKNMVADEFPLLQALVEHDIPVPRPLLLETDPSVLTQPFLIVEGVNGRPDLPAWETRRDMLEAVTRDHAWILARIHALPPAQMPVREFTSGGASEEVAAYIGMWRDVWHECRPADSAAVDEAIELLLRNIPDDLGPKCFVHADYGFHNLLAEEGRVTAVLDWEFAHFGEAAEDLGYCRQFVEPLGLWDQFMDAYFSAGGQGLAELRIPFYQVWRGVRNAICCALGRQAFESGRNTDLRLAYAGQILYRGYVADMEQQLGNLSA